MFDTMKVARKIKEARIAKNLTQMNLADAMGVSYQAVSNWERGNSMPDISKLEDLCRTLELSVAELLGMENRETQTVEKVLEEKELTVEELGDVAPMLPPAEVKKQAKSKKWNVASLIPIAPFLDEDMLEEILKDLEVESLLVLQSLAPYLEEDVLDQLARKAPKDDFNGIAAMACFLEPDTLDYLLKRCEAKPEDWAFVATLAPFLDEDTLDWFVKKWGDDLDEKMLKSLAPHLDENTLDALAEQRIAAGKLKDLEGLYPFMDEDTIRKIVRALMEAGDFEGVQEAAPFL